MLWLQVYTFYQIAQILFQAHKSYEVYFNQYFKKINKYFNENEIFLIYLHFYREYDVIC